MIFGTGLLSSVVGINALDSPGNRFLIFCCARQNDANLQASMCVKVLGQFQIRQLLSRIRWDSMFLRGY